MTFILHTYIVIDALMHWCIVNALMHCDALMHWLHWWCILMHLMHLMHWDGCGEWVSVRTKRFEKNFQFTINKVYLYIWHVFFLYTLYPSLLHLRQIGQTWHPQSTTPGTAVFFGIIGQRSFGVVHQSINNVWQGCSRQTTNLFAVVQ